MLTATDLKNGTTFLNNDTPYKVERFAHQKIGRGGATVRVSARNLSTGSLEEMTFNSTNKFDQISTIKKRLQYLFHDSETASFMDPRTFEQIEIPMEILEYEIQFVKDGEEVDVLFWDEKPLSIDLAPKVVLEVIECDPGIKGNSASNMYKSAKLENGIEVKVPLFIKIGDQVRVDTRDGSYVERVTS